MYVIEKILDFKSGLHQTTAFMSNLALPLFLKKTFTVIQPYNCLHTVSDSNATTGELSSWGRDPISCKIWNIHYPSLYRKSFPTSSLGNVKPRKDLSQEVAWSLLPFRSLGLVAVRQKIGGIIKCVAGHAISGLCLLCLFLFYFQPKFRLHWCYLIRWPLAYFISYGMLHFTDLERKQLFHRSCFNSNEWYMIYKPEYLGLVIYIFHFI